MEQLARRLGGTGADIISADETADWPEGKLEELIAAGIIREIEHAKGIVCDECEENCYIEPNICTNPETGKAVGVFACTRNPDIGRIEVDLNRLRQWRINKRELWRLIYGFESEWQVPWDDSNSEYITLKEAVNLANDDSITIRQMSRLLEGPDYPVQHMHKGQRCKIHLGQFRAWLKYAQQGIVTDKAIQKYLKGIEERKASVQKNKSKKRLPDGR